MIVGALGYPTTKLGGYIGKDPKFLALSTAQDSKCINVLQVF